MNILIVDDSNVMRKIIIRTLRQAGFEGHTINQAQDGANVRRPPEAINAAARTRNRMMRLATCQRLAWRTGSI